MTDLYIPDPADFAPGLTTSAKMLATTVIVLLMLVVATSLVAPNGGNGSGSGDDNVLRVTPADDIQKILDRAVSGAIIEFQRGEYRMRLRLAEKRELVLRGVEGAVLTHSEGQPLEIAEHCRDLRIENLEIRFAGAEQRTFPALIVRDSSRIVFADCVLATTGGDGVVGERVASLALNNSEVRATSWGLVLSGCEQLAIDGLLVADASRGAIVAEGCSGVIKRLTSRANRTALRTTGRGQLTLSACTLTGPKQRGVGVHIGKDATVAIEGGTSIADFEKGVLVKDGATLLGKGFKVGNNRYVGVHVEERAQMVRLMDLDHEAQKRPLDVDRRTIPDHWEIAKGLLPK